LQVFFGPRSGAQFLFLAAIAATGCRQEAPPGSDFAAQRQLMGSTAVEDTQHRPFAFSLLGKSAKNTKNLLAGVTLRAAVTES
jgi:hypothetical protein